MFTKGKLVSVTLIMALVAIAASLACSSQPATSQIDDAQAQRIAAQAAEAAAAAVSAQAQPQVTAEEIQSMVMSSMEGMAESQVSAEDIQAMVESAVSDAASEGASADEIAAMVESAVMAATEDSVTAADVESAISSAVMEAQESVDLDAVISEALEARAMMEAEQLRNITITFGDLNWDSAQLQNRIAQYIVEKGYGYSTDTKFGSTLPLFQGLRNGDTDIAMEIWLPNQNDTWADARAAGEVVSVGRSLGDDWQSAFVIPKYLQEQYPELDNVEDLKDDQFKALFQTAETGDKARLVSCIIGWACEEVNAAQVTAYGLDDHVQIVNPGDGAALNADLYGAYEREEPWLGYQWGTNAPALELDLVRLEEPAYSDECWLTTKACAYQDATILIAVNPDLLTRAPDVIAMLRNWDLGIDTYKAIARWQAANPDAKAEDTAVWWLDSNPDIWGGWVTADAKAGIQAALDARETADGWPVE